MEIDYDGMTEKEKQEWDDRADRQKISRFPIRVERRAPKPSDSLKEKIATPNQIRCATIANLRDLKLSKLSPYAIRLMASSNAAKATPRKRIRHWADPRKTTQQLPKKKFKRKKGHEIVQSAAVDSSFWAEKRTAKKWNWDAK